MAPASRLSAGVGSGTGVSGLPASGPLPLPPPQDVAKMERLSKPASQGRAGRCCRDMGFTSGSSLMNLKRVCAKDGPSRCWLIMRREHGSTCLFQPVANAAPDARRQTPDPWPGAASTNYPGHGQRWCKVAGAGCGKGASAVTGETYGCGTWAALFPLLQLQLRSSSGLPCWLADPLEVAQCREVRTSRPPPESHWHRACTRLCAPSRGPAGSGA